MDPDVDRSKSQRRLKACGNALPADHPAPILLLNLGTGARSWTAADHFLDRSAQGLLRLPDARRALRPKTQLPALLPPRLRLLPLLRCDLLGDVGGGDPVWVRGPLDGRTPAQGEPAPSTAPDSP
jgi:hypothetical protein